MYSFKSHLNWLLQVSCSFESHYPIYICILSPPALYQKFDQFDYLVFIKITENGRELWPLETPPVTPDVLTRTLGMAVETAPHLAMSTVVVLCPSCESESPGKLYHHPYVCGGAWKFVFFQSSLDGSNN